jgi:aminocarboxymuconate-semialdehyde decarboxylase
MRGPKAGQHLNSWAEWFDLDKQFEYMDSLGHRVDVVCSIGPFSVSFSDMPVEEGRDYAIMWNEEMAGAQKKYPGRLWASAAVPLQDTKVAIEVLDDAVNRLGLMGVNLPGSVGEDARIDAERLQPFYAHVEKLGLPMFLHPTDVIFQDMLSDGYDGALHLSLGRVIEVSTAAMRLILSGTMERHPNLKVVMSHTGGALPYQSGRMDKNSKAAKLPRPISEYLKRMYTDTVSPHTAGMQFAIDYYGIDRVMYGTDYPCWDPAPCLKLLEDVRLSPADKQKLFYDNARRILGLKDPAPTKTDAKREPALV